MPLLPDDEARLRALQDDPFWTPVVIRLELPQGLVEAWRTQIDADHVPGTPFSRMEAQIAAWVVEGMTRRHGSAATALRAALHARFEAWGRVRPSPFGSDDAKDDARYLRLARRVSASLRMAGWEETAAKIDAEADRTVRDAKEDRKRSRRG